MKHIAYIKSKPMMSGNSSIPDGAFCGNGDLGAVLGNSSHGIRIFITKCDFWIAEENATSTGGISPLAFLDIDVPEKLYSHYYAEQRMDEGEVFLNFKDAQDSLSVCLSVCATQNAILLQVDSNISTKPVLEPFTCKEPYESVSCNTENGISFVTRAFSGESLKFETSGAVAMKKVADNKYIIFAVTNHDSISFDSDCKKFITTAGINTFEQLSDEHCKWWKSFWSKSSFSVSDKELENAWYASQYALAVCARNIKFPPGLYGNFITKNTVNWKGDYHLNYNYQAPFYALFSSNHIELSDCYIAPLEDFYEKGNEFAGKIGCRGIYYPVGIGPLGMCTERKEPFDSLSFERLFLGQKSNAVHAADILVFRWQATRECDYARVHIYPYLKACADFWESYLVFENGVYNVVDDSIHEVPYYKDNFDEKKYKKEIHAKNNLLTLGLLRMLFSTLIEISQALGEDNNRREKWQDILANLAPFPTQIKKLKRVFRYTQKGMAWSKGNFLCLQHVYPANAINFESNEKLLKIARNTFLLMTVGMMVMRAVQFIHVQCVSAFHRNL